MVHHIPNDLKFVKLTFCVPRNRSRVILLFINSTEHSHEILRQKKKEKKEKRRRRKGIVETEKILARSFAFFRDFPRFLFYQVVVRSEILQTGLIEPVPSLFPETQASLF